MLTRMRQVGISRSKLAAKIGVNPAYVSKILRGDTNFSLETMVKIANALESEFRCHLQPVGAKAQWLDVYSTRTRKTSFRVTDVPRNVIHPERFRRVSWPINTETDHEKRAAIA